MQKNWNLLLIVVKVVVPVYLIVVEIDLEDE
jgi:hypothetical protein